MAFCWSFNIIFFNWPAVPGWTLKIPEQQQAVDVARHFKKTRKA